MKFRPIVGLLIVLMGCSCYGQTSKGEQQTENGPNLGATHIDTPGIKNFYVHSVNSQHKVN